VYGIFDDKWNLPEYYSVIMQPFIISPMINISDIMVNLQVLFENGKLNKSQIIDNNIINRIIFTAHPFPILERYDPVTSTQYFIPLDTLSNYELYNYKYKNLVFGTGERKCSGQKYAYIILKLFIKLYHDNNERIRPILNHKYSGRDNDSFYIYEVLYTGYIILSILVYD